MSAYFPGFFPYNRGNKAGGVVRMATNKRVFTLRLNDDVFDKIGALATEEHRSMTNYIEYVLLKHIEEVEKQRGTIRVDESDDQ